MRLPWKSRKGNFWIPGVSALMPQTASMGLPLSWNILNVLATHCDDHTKNFSFQLKQGGEWRLSPAYDVCYAYDPANAWVSQQTLSINGKRRNLNKEDLMTVAKANRIKKGENIIHEINTVVKNWKAFAARAKVRKDLRKTIEENLHPLP